MTQVEEPRRAVHAAPFGMPWPDAETRAAGPLAPVGPGTLMEKTIPVNLVEPYLTGQRWVIAGFAYRAREAWDVRAAADAGSWVLRWRALAMQRYMPVAGAPGVFFVEAGPIPVGTEMHWLTPADDEFVAWHDGQAWLRPAGPRPASEETPGAPR